MKMAKTFVVIAFCGFAASISPMVGSSLPGTPPGLRPVVLVEDIPDGVIIETKPVVRIYDMPSPAPDTRRATLQHRDFDAILDEINPDLNEELPRITNNRRNFSDDEKICLAKNIYFEARNESMRGQVAVALVTLNRLYSKQYPDDICAVVYDHMQFSWYWDGLPDRPMQRAAFDRAMLIATVMLTTELEIADFTAGSTHYHADPRLAMYQELGFETPYWAGHMAKTTQIGAHIFYREPEL